ncbi:ATP-binding protein [Rhizobium leguminosarum]
MKKNDEIHLGHSLDARRSAAAINHLRSQLKPERLATNDKLAKLWTEYFPLERDGDLQAGLKLLVDSTSTFSYGKPDKRRILAILGRSGAGKSTAIAKHISSIKEMQPYDDEDGVRIYPVLYMELPSPCSPTRIALDGIEALGHHFKGRVTRDAAWKEFERLLKLHKVMFVILDEAQNAIENANKTEISVLGDNFKMLTQRPDWPVRLVLAGVPPLGSFLARKQLYTRRTVVRFDTLDIDANLDMIKSVFETVVVSDAGLKIGLDANNDFLQRLLHANFCEFGSTVQMIRSAVELPIRDKRAAVELEDFVETYASFSGARRRQNVFLVENWRDLDPTEALLTEEDREWQQDRVRTKGKNASKYSVRPE